MINDTLSWLSRSNDNLMLAMLGVAALYLLGYYTLVVTKARRVDMSPFAHFINVVLSPIIGSVIALVMLQSAEYVTRNTFYTLYFVRAHSETFLHSFQFALNT